MSSFFVANYGYYVSLYNRKNVIRGGNDLQIIKEMDKIYPEKLRLIYDRPAKLYVEGDANILNSKSIAIIGSRDCSKYGMQVAYKFGHELAKKGITIISGLARGIDAYSHWGAVKVKRKSNCGFGKRTK